MPLRIRIGVLLALLVLVGAGVLADRVRPYSTAMAPDVALKPVAYREVGRASWYGPGFHGRRTASGERFDQNRLTAAHRKLPLGTRVTVTNLANGRSVRVEINDRGPYIRGRMLDLSKAAARRLGMVRDGVVRVRIEATRLRRAAAPSDGQPG
jgi:rare lipoprotein A